MQMKPEHAARIIEAAEEMISISLRRTRDLEGATEDLQARSDLRIDDPRRVRAAMEVMDAFKEGEVRSHREGMRVMVEMLAGLVGKSTAELMDNLEGLAGMIEIGPEGVRIATEGIDGDEEFDAEVLKAKLDDKLEAPADTTPVGESEIPGIDLEATAPEPEIRAEGVRDADGGVA